MGIGWVCEEHTDQPVEHRIASDIFCSYAGLPCPDCNCNVGELPRRPDGWKSIARVGNVEAFPVPLNCPLCGERTTFVDVLDGPTYIFTCMIHGRLILPPDGRVRQQPS
jgi:hypothetical protein